MNRAIKFKKLPDGSVRISIDGWIQGVVRNLDQAKKYAEVCNYGR